MRTKNDCLFRHTWHATSSGVFVNIQCYTVILTVYVIVSGFCSKHKVKQILPLFILINKIN